MTEAAFQRAVIERARLLGWRVFHVADSRREVRERGVSRLVGDAGAKGWPDLVLVHPQRGVLYRELKSDTGRLTAEQLAWLDALREAGANAGVWRPRDLNAIDAELGARKREAA